VSPRRGQIVSDLRREQDVCLADNDRVSPRLSHRRDALSPPITHLLIAAVLIMLLATIVNLSLVGRGDGP
jgi:hypothetical protein